MGKPIGPRKRHAAQPALCHACHQILIAIADVDPRPNIVRWCEHRRTLAYASRAGSGPIAQWELHLVPTDEELTRDHSARIVQLMAAGDTAKPVKH